MLRLDGSKDLPTVPWLYRWSTAASCVSLFQRRPVLHYMVNWLVGEHTPQATWRWGWSTGGGPLGLTMIDQRVRDQILEIKNSWKDCPRRFPSKWTMKHLLLIQRSGTCRWCRKPPELVLLLGVTTGDWKLVGSVQTSWNHWWCFQTQNYGISPAGYRWL